MPGDDAHLLKSFMEAMIEFESEDGAADADGLSVADLASVSVRGGYARGLCDGTSMRPGRELLASGTVLWWCEHGPDGPEYIGRIAMRHTPLPGRGHVEFAVRPSRRRQGHGTAMLGTALPILHGRGIDPVLITCRYDDIAAGKVIEANGGLQFAQDDGTRWFEVPTRG